MNAIKYSILVAVGVYFVYGEVRAGLDYWLPAVGYAAEHGYVWAQFAFLAIVGAGLLISLGPGRWSGQSGKELVFCQAISAS